MMWHKPCVGIDGGSIAGLNTTPIFACFWTNYSNYFLMNMKVPLEFVDQFLYLTSRPFESRRPVVDCHQLVLGRPVSVHFETEFCPLKAKFGIQTHNTFR